MKKEVNVAYICEICGFVYRTEEEAIKCEGKHKGVANLILSNEMFYPDDKYPTRIVFKDEFNNDIVYYKN